LDANDLNFNGFTGEGFLENMDKILETKSRNFVNSSNNVSNSFTHNSSVNKHSGTSAATNSSIPTKAMGVVSRSSSRNSIRGNEIRQDSDLLNSSVNSNASTLKNQPLSGRSHDRERDRDLAPQTNQSSVNITHSRPSSRSIRTNGIASSVPSRLIKEDEEYIKAFGSKPRVPRTPDVRDRTGRSVM